jgi:hypothetical protein
LPKGQSSSYVSRSLSGTQRFDPASSYAGSISSVSTPFPIGDFAFQTKETPRVLRTCFVPSGPGLRRLTWGRLSQVLSMFNSAPGAVPEKRQTEVTSEDAVRRPNASVIPVIVGGPVFHVCVLSRGLEQRHHTSAARAANGAALVSVSSSPPPSPWRPSPRRAPVAQAHTRVPHRPVATKRAMPARDFHAQQNDHRCVPPGRNAGGGAAR